jgi:lambda repressor-like predicted transcriptional regulator
MGRPSNHLSSVQPWAAHLDRLLPKDSVDIPAEIITAALRMRGVTMSGLSRRHGYRVNAVRQVARGKRSRAVERLIADFLKVRPDVLWPSRYAARLAVRDAQEAA